MLVRSITDGGSENNPPSLGKKQEKKKNLTAGKLTLQGNTKISAFLLHMESLCFFLSLKPPHWVEYKR